MNRSALAILIASLSAAMSCTWTLQTTASVAVARDADLCFGQVPTLVGSRDQWSLYGSDARDVVVTNGSGNVDTGDGDDLVCITGEIGLADGEDESPYLFTGAGNDRVDASKTKSEFGTFLGMVRTSSSEDPSVILFLPALTHGQIQTLT